MGMNKNYAMRFRTSIPNIYQNILPREEVNSILDNTSKDEIVCVVAPYGYGKTFSVVSWLQNHTYETAWLDLNKNNISDERFIAYFTAAILALGGGTEGDFEFLENPEYRYDPRTFLINAVSEAMQDGQEKILVIDNFHLISSEVIQGFIKEIIYILLGKWRIIAISRADLQPVFNDLILKRHVRFVTIKELSLSKKEIMDYFLLNGRKTTEQDIQRLQNETDGWPAALNAVLTVPGDNVMNSYEIFRAYIMVLFETEIWKNLEQNLKQFLLKTSILDILTPSYCRAVTDGNGTLPILKWLDANGLFITKLDEKDTYSYYHVFREFLKEKRNTSGIDIRELFKKYGWWLYEQGKVEESFQYFFKAGDMYAVNQVLKVLDKANMDMEYYINIVGCITQLNAGDLKDFPIIVSNMALIYYLTGDIDKMQQLRRTLLTWNASSMSYVTLEDYAVFQSELGWLCYLDAEEPLGNNPKLLEWSHTNNEITEESDLNHYSVIIFPSMLRGVRDYGEDSLLNLEGIIGRYEKGDRSILKKNEEIWNSYLMFAEYLYEKENFAKSEEIVRRIMSIVEERKYTYLYFICTAVLVKLIRAVHNPKEIPILTDRLERMIIRDRADHLLTNFHAFQQRNRLADGKTGFMEAFRDENRDNISKPDFYLLYRQITMARVMLSEGDYNPAVLLLKQLTILCKKYRRPTDLIEVQILKSAALYAMGFEEDACESLQSAVGAARKFGYIRIFSDEAKDIMPVLNLLQKRMTENYIKKIIISCKKSLARSAIARSEQGMQQINITKTEVEILRSLQADMSYNEIAVDNGIRISTVKSHIHSIYSKLDVNNKTAAIIAAQKMGILDTV